MLIGWGPFRLTITGYSFNELVRTTSGRVVSAPVLQAPMPTHLLGAGEDTISLVSTLYPRAQAPMVMAQVAGIRAAIKHQTPFMMLHISGLIFGRYVGVSLKEKHSYIDVNGIPNKVDCELTLKRYNGGAGGLLSAILDIF
ncbi:hypothetical protein GCM10007094_24030 [Pseudovibrio japonicus]|uniref:Uncharacterized protein n=1 Tax=Pseudovibrio japonicus TaxID=366534 RepID=A0ABQ3EJA3_9HYPH|nr:phage tail protein [Pseudovibrio japonicus]GHB34148.1 hypothetical protein GCM10007094_24030 [Pseudovibrio japonicus]